MAAAGRHHRRLRDRVQPRYALNRALNFRSHGAVGPQLTVYAAVVTVNPVYVVASRCGRVPARVPAVVRSHIDSGTAVPDAGSVPTLNHGWSLR